ncbi:MAG: hypothetical protein LW697_09045, partial [Blastopirellula sp.]|nr:hypothetical protein [Blastopirellula sp.]
MFQLRAPFPPAGDQPAAISSLVRGLREGKREEQAPLHAVRPFGSSPAGPDAWYFSRYDQGTLAG